MHALAHVSNILVVEAKGDVYWWEAKHKFQSHFVSARRQIKKLKISMTVDKCTVHLRRPAGLIVSVSVYRLNSSYMDTPDELWLVPVTFNSKIERKRITILSGLRSRHTKWMATKNIDWAQLNGSVTTWESCYITATAQIHYFNHLAILVRWAWSSKKGETMRTIGQIIKQTISAVELN